MIDSEGSDEGVEEGRKLGILDDFDTSDGRIFDGLVEGTGKFVMES